ncbi:MAG: hypothetical protein ACRDZ5_00555 [Acidimicrobiales bacterium]
MVRRWRSALVVLASFAVVLAGCGSSGAAGGTRAHADTAPRRAGNTSNSGNTGQQPASPRAQLLVALRGAPSSFEEQIRIEERGLGALGAGIKGPFVIAATGRFDASTRRVGFVLNLPSNLGAIGSMGSMGSIGQIPSLQMIVDEQADAVYLKVPPSLRRQARTAKAWVEESLGGLTSGEANAFGGGAFDPPRFMGQLGTLAAGAAQVERLGQVELGGVATTEYEIVTSGSGLAKVLAKKASPLATKSSKILSLIGTLRYYVYVDGSSRVREIRFSIDLGKLLSHVLGSLVPGQGSLPASAKAGLSKVSETCTMTIGDFGAAVHVLVPPPSEVHKLSGNGLNLLGLPSSTGSSASL